MLSRIGITGSTTNTANTAIGDDTTSGNMHDNSPDAAPRVLLRATAIVAQSNHDALPDDTKAQQEVKEDVLNKEEEKQTQKDKEKEKNQAWGEEEEEVQEEEEAEKVRYTTANPIDLVQPIDAPASMSWEWGVAVDAEPEPETETNPIGTCISCSTPVHRHLLCYLCHVIMTCCDDCYAKPEVHRHATNHYRECKQITLTPQQKMAQVYAITPDLYQEQYRRPCRKCAICVDEDRYDCPYCAKHYCSTTCRNADRERHETDGECIKRVTQQLPPFFIAESTGSSILIPDLLAHAISFLSVFQWSQAARVNRAWRNATLLPSAFSHQVDYLSLEAPNIAPNIGPAHRACFRSHDWVSQPFENEPELVLLRQYSHLQRFHYYNKYYSYPHYSSPPDNIIEVLDLLPHATLRSLILATQLDLASVSPSIARFTRLEVLSVDLIRGSALLHDFAHTVLQQVTHLREFTLEVCEVPKSPVEKSSEEYKTSFEEEEEENKDRNALAQIVKTISLHLSLLTRLSMSSYQHGLSQIFVSHQFPQIRELVLKEIFRVDTSDEDLSAFTQLGGTFPSLTSLSFTAKFITALLFDNAHSLKKQLMMDSLIECVNSFGPRLTSLNFHLDIHSQVIDQAFEDVIEYNDQGLEFNVHQLERLLAHSSGLEILTFMYVDSRLSSEEEVAVLARLTPRIKMLGIMIDDSATVSTMIESLMVSFPDLENLVLRLPEWLGQSFVLLPPSPQFLEVRDSLPTIRRVFLTGFDSETQLPALLRLLPRIDKLQIRAGAKMTPSRLFEYAQYRPLAFVQPQAAHQPSTIIRLQTIDDGQLNWLDPTEEHNSSIVVQPILTYLSENLHFHYQRGRELASQSNHASTSASSSLSPLPLTLATDAANSESHRCMFSRVRTWHWQWVAIDSSTRESLRAEPVLLPPAFAIYRDRVWTRTHPDDISKNCDASRIYKGLVRQVEECEPLWLQDFISAKR